MNTQELQVENGNYTRIANAILDSLVSAPISTSELRIVLAVIRKTYGYQKKEDSLSLSQLCEMTKISKRNVIYLLQNLEAKKILIISREKYQCNLVRFNKYSDTWVVQNYAEQVGRNRNRAKTYSAKLRNVVVQSYDSSAKLGKKVVQNYDENVRSFAHTKEKRNTKEIPEATSGLPIKKKTMKKNSFRYREDLSSDAFESTIDLDTGERPPAPKKENVSEKYWAMIEWAKKRRGTGFVNVPKQFKAFSLARQNKISPERLKDRWIEMEKEEFWKKNGFDWTSVLGSFDKRQ